MPEIPYIPRGAVADEVVRRAERERLLGPLLQAVAVGALELPDDVQDLALDAHSQAQQWCLLIEGCYVQIRRRFDELGGLRHLVLKGAAVAHLDEDDPSDRSFADLDLLVAASDLDAVVAALEGRGGRRPWAERRPGFDRRFSKSVTVTGVDRVEVDVHRSLCDGVHGFRIPLDRLFADPDHFDLGGTRVAAPTAVHRLLHSAYHSVLGSPVPPLRTLRDLAGALTQPALGPNEVVPEARRWRGEAVVAEAVRSTIATLGVDLPAWEAWVDGAEISRAEVRLVDRQRREGSNLRPGKLLALGELTWRHRAAYLHALAVPTREHLASRGLRRRDLVVRGVGGLARCR